MSKIAVVTGGRDYFPSTRDLNILERLLIKNSITVFRNGQARGVDKFAANYVRTQLLNIVVEDYEVTSSDWAQYGNGAGHRRNNIMLTKSPGADLLIAFPGGKGTQGCIERAQILNIPVVYIK